MKSAKTSASALLVALGGIAAAASVQTNAAGSKMPSLMQLKIDQHAKQREAGAFNIDRYEVLWGTKCVDGKAGEYSCSNIDLKSHLRHQDMDSNTGEGNDVWGWTSADGREFGAVGQTDGTAFVEIKPDGLLIYLGRLPTQTSDSLWRDMKSIGDHMYIGSEAPDHGLQVFDMKKLLDIDPSSPVTFNVTSDLTAHYSDFGSSHNIVANEETNLIYAVGTLVKERCRGGLWMVDVTDPANPKFAGCEAADGYVHDAQCVIYDGPDSQYKGREICFNFNEDTLTITDVTDKSAPKQLSKTAYSGNSYTHQGWLVNADMTFLLLDDELDEIDGAGPAADGHTTTRIFNVSELAAPQLTGIYKSPVVSIDHNQYVVNGVSYMANYGSGLRMVNVSSVTQDPTGGSFKEIGFFDCYPEDDPDGTTEFFGAWSVYPFFKSGYVLLNCIERGVFALKYTG